MPTPTPTGHYPVAQLPSTIARAVGELDGQEPLDIIAGCFQATLDAVFIDWHSLRDAYDGLERPSDWPALVPPDCAKDRLEFDAEMMRMCSYEAEAGDGTKVVVGHLRPEFVGPSTRAFGNVWTI